MTRQVYAKCPRTGVWMWQYVDRGPGGRGDERPRGAPLVPRGVDKPTANYGRKIVRGGAA